MNSTLSTRVSHSSLTCVPSCRATSSQAWSWLPRMPLANTEKFWAQLTQQPPRLKLQAHCEPCSELTIQEMLATVLPMDLTSKESKDYSSQRASDLQLPSIIVLAALLSHTSFRKAVLDKSSTWYCRKALRFHRWKCSLLTGLLLKNSSKYKGVLPEFVGMVEHMTTGPCIVLEVRQENAVKSFRDLCGPTDPEIAKYLRPNTIRAKFGHSRTINAVHCTDLEEDGLLEVEYFFSIQQQWDWH